jgi:protein pelota
MRLLSYQEKTRTATVQVTSLNDLWILDSLISPGTEVEARTTRMTKVNETRGSRVSTILRVKAEKVSYEPFTNTLRITGKIISDPDELGILGSYHTISVELGTTLSMTKDWSKSEIKELTDLKNGYGIIVVSIDRDEVAVAKIWDYGIQILASWSPGIPGKQDPRRDAIERDKLRVVARAVAQFFASEELGVMSGPGSLKRKLFDEVRSLLGHDKIKITFVDTQYGGVAGVKEVFQKTLEQGFIKSARLREEVKAVERLLALLGSHADRIALGLEEVQYALSIGAVEELLISTKLLRNSYENVRPLIAQAEAYATNVAFVSDLHERGEQLLGLSGVAAVLRYPVKRQRSS